MPDNKFILESANAAIRAGDYEGFLAQCTEDTEWNFLGDTILRGKEAVRQWMATAYTEPPDFHVDSLIAEGDCVAALGSIVVRDGLGAAVPHDYCDVWQFRDGKMASLRAFVIRSNA